MLLNKFSFISHSHACARVCGHARTHMCAQNNGYLSFCLTMMRDNEMEENYKLATYTQRLKSIHHSQIEKLFEQQSCLVKNQYI